MNYNDHKKYYYDNGNISSEFYYLNDKFHRTDGPAVIYYYENGNIQSELYYLNGKLHRTDGPAEIYYCDNGDISSEHYYLNYEVIDVKSNKEFEKYIKTLCLK